MKKYLLAAIFLLTLNLHAQTMSVYIENKCVEYSVENVDSVVFKYNATTQLNKSLNLKEKKVLYSGDSITKGYISGTETTSDNFPCNLSDIMRINNYSNVAKGGSAFTNVGTGQIIEQIKNVSISNYDAIVIAGGVNDWQGCADMESFEKSIVGICDYINENSKASADVVFITPIEHGGWDDAKKIINKISLQEYRNKMTDIIMSKDKYNRFSVIQGTDLGFPNKNESKSKISTWYGDKLHPTTWGYKMYAINLANILLGGGE